MCANQMILSVNDHESLKHKKRECNICHARRQQPRQRPVSHFSSPTVREGRGRGRRRSLQGWVLEFGTTHSCSPGAVKKFKTEIGRARLPPSLMGQGFAGAMARPEANHT